MENKTETDGKGTENPENGLMGDYQCRWCKRWFPIFYENKGKSYWGDRGRYNFRGATANFKKHPNQTIIYNPKSGILYGNKKTK